MPRITDPNTIRAILETDRAWSIYALGDLAPGFFEYCEWFAPQDRSAIILLYRAFDTPVIFAYGAVERVRSAFVEIGGERAMYLSIRPEILPLIKERYDVQHETAMWRMILPPNGLRPLPTEEGVERLTPNDLAA